MRRHRSTVAALAILGTVLASGVSQAQEALSTRVTYYVDRGTTYSGTQTRPGVAACSWPWPIGTRFRFAVDGREVVCEDRGQLGQGNWIDVWVPSLSEGRALARQYGDYTTAEVMR